MSGRSSTVQHAAWYRLQPSIVQRFRVDRHHYCTCMGSDRHIGMPEAEVDIAVSWPIVCHPLHPRLPGPSQPSLCSDSTTSRSMWEQVSKRLRPRTATPLQTYIEFTPLQVDSATSRRHREQAPERLALAPVLLPSPPVCCGVAPSEMLTACWHGLAGTGAGVGITAASCTCSTGNTFR